MEKKFEEVDMTYDEFCHKREHGWLDLGKFVKNFSAQSREAVGNSDKTKNWLMFKDAPYMYKGIFCKDEESAGYAYAELLVEELAKQVGFKAAYYDLATFKDEKGVITKSVLEKDTQELVSLCSLLDEEKDTQDLEELMTNMKEALINQGIVEEDVEQIQQEFVQRRIFDLFILATDTHTENISFIFELDEKGKKRACLAPVFDSESSLLLDHTKSQMDLILREKLERTSVQYIEQVEPTLYYGDSWNEQLSFLASQEGGEDFINKCAESLNLQKAIQNVEKKTNHEMPLSVKKFASFVFDKRLESIDSYMEMDEIGDKYCIEIAQMSKKVQIPEFTRLLRRVFDEITPELEKKIKDLEERC